MADIKSKLILDNTQFNRAAKTSKKLIGGVGAGLSAVGGAAKTAAIAVTAATGAFAALITVNAQAIDRLGKVAKTTGFAAETLQKFQFAAEQSGVTSDNAALALRRFARRLGEAQKNTGELLPALKKLGIQTRDNEGNLKSAEQVLFEFADGLSKTENQSERLALAFKAFDSEGAELVTVLKDGSAGLNEFFTEADRLGFVLNTKAIQGVENFNDSFGKLKITITGITRQFTAALAPALEEITKKLTDLIIDTIEAEGGMEQFGKFLKDKFLTGLVAVLRVLEKVVNIVIALTNAIINLARKLDIPGLPALSEDAVKAAEKLGTLKNALRDLEGGGFIGRGASTGIDEIRRALNTLDRAGVDVEKFQKRVQDIGILDEMFGDPRIDTLRADIKAFLDAAVAEIDTQIGTFKQVDFSSLIDMLLGNTEEAKEKARAATEAVIEEVIVTGKKLKPTLLDTILDALFPVELVDKFFDTYDNEAATTAEKIRAMFQLVGDAINHALPNLREKLTNSGIGDFVTTLEDGLVKAGQMLEDSLASAIATGKADFTSLGEHIKQVLAKAMVQKFITGPIMSLFGLASGGPAKAGQPYIVGEEGPELFIPKNSGTVIPNDITESLAGGQGMAMGGGQVTYNINAVDARSFKQLVASDPEYLYNVTQVGARRQPR